MKRLAAIFALVFFAALLSPAQTAMTDKARIKHIKEDFPVAELDHKSWEKAEKIEIEHYWSGEKAPDGRGFSARLLWSDAAIYVRFEANQKEPLNISQKPNLGGKTRGLWDRDVCEIFLAPKRDDFRHYFEFEVAPTGEWIDLGIYQKPDERITDWDYASGMKAAARIEKEKVVMALTVEWKAFGTKRPKPGDIWLGNILRATGSEPNRGYLAWKPTMTKEPNFHVPEKFGQFEFVR
ncbi:MAG: carbohydrate-binding family 9-like protein [Pyrinomonadaceae bacterium]